MPTPKPKRNKRSKSSCPDGWHPAGYSVPIHLTVKQQAYCRRAIGITRFVYNLCVATHRFCRVNRLPWPSWQDLYKAFNACKCEDYPFVTEAASRVAEGAFMDFGTAIKNWRDTDHKAGPPRFHKKRLTGTGSFRAASGVAQIKYNGKRRIQLPGLGSVKLRHTLPKGLVYEAHIKFLNGQWKLSVNYWAAPKELPEQDDRIEAGAVDTGINPLATDSEGEVWENPKAYYQAERKLARWQRAQTRRTKQSRGWWEAQRKIDRLQRHTNGLRRNAVRHARTQVQEPRDRGPERQGHDAGTYTQSPSRCQHGRGKTPPTLQRALAQLRSLVSPQVLSIEQDVLQLRLRERETQAAAFLAVPVLHHHPRTELQRSGQPARIVDPPCRQWGDAPRREGSGHWSNQG